MTSTALSSIRADAVSDWEPCEDAFYCEEHLYDLQWADVDLDVQRLCAAPFGGPMAIMRDEAALVVVRSGAPSGGRPVVRIFSAAGTLLGSLLWDGGRLAGWGWSNDLELMMVDVGGKVSFFTPAGSRAPRHVSFGPELEAEGVSHAVVYADGLVVLGAVSRQLWMVAGLAQPRATRLPVIPGLTSSSSSSGNSGGSGPPSGGAKAGSGGGVAGGATSRGSSGGAASGTMCIAVLEPRFTLSGGLEVIVAHGETLWCVDDSRATDQALPAGCGGVAAMSVAPNGAYVALACCDGRLRVMTSDLSQQLSEFDTRSSVPPAALAWCGIDAVAMRWEGLLLLVGPYGEWMKRPCEGPVSLTTEVDGLRCVCNTTTTLLRRVPDALVKVYKPGSTSPAAQLLDARDLFDGGSARADLVLRSIADHLGEAVEGCAAAAGLDLSVQRQKALMRAAVFGRAFAPEVPPGLLRDVALKLRVMNALRDAAVGLPLTMPQLEALTLPVVVSRLVLLRQHLLAYRVADALGGAGCQQVLLHWAAAKISASASMPDGPLREALAAKMSLLPAPAWAPLAAHAQAAGRRSLALRLLEEEPSPAQQVPLLLSLARGSAASHAQQGGGAADDPASGGGSGSNNNEDALARALRKAVESGDPDLVHLVLFAAYKSLQLPEFWRLVCSRPLARRLFVKYARLKEPELLETLYVTQQLHAEGAELALEGALRMLMPSTRGAQPDSAAVNAAVSGLQTASQRFAQCKDAAWQSRAASEAALLYKEQLRLERETGQALFVGLSLADTLSTALRHGHGRLAATLRKSFSVPDGRWYWIKLGALAAVHDWDALDAWASERKSPIGWEPFLEAAQRHGAPREVQARLIARMPDSRAKADAFEAIGAQREAAEVAAKLRDGDLFARIQGAVSANSPAGLAIAQLRERFVAR